VRGFFLKDADLQLIPLGFQRSQPFFRRLGDDAFLYCGCNVVNFLVDLFQFFLQCRQMCVFSLLVFHKGIRQHCNHAVLQHIPKRTLDYKRFNQFFAERFHSAPLALFALAMPTFIIVVGCPGMTCAAVAHHQRTTVAAYQLSCQNEVLVTLRSGRRFFVRFHTSLHLVKCLLVDQRRECVFRDYIPIAVFAQIAAVPQHILEAALHKFSAVAGSYAASIHVRAKFLDRLSPGVALEDFFNNGTHHRIRLVVAFLIDAIA